jgi:flagellar basal-body rod protein FlgB
MERAVDASVLRQKVIANNIANVDTPNFKRSDVLFEEYLRQELEAVKKPSFTAFATHPNHIPIGTVGSGRPAQPRIVTDETSAMNNNRNNVDIDYEMALMAKNQLYYNALIEQINYDIKHLRTAIGGRS